MQSIDSRRKTRQKELFEAYKKAQKSGNKGHASLAGRAYYSYLRKGMPTLADEGAIFKTILAMKSEAVKSYNVES